MSNYLAWVYRKIFLALRPKSFPGLLFAGLLLLAVPLILPLIYSAVSINELSRQGRQAMYQAHQAAQFSKILADEAGIMEHSVKLSLILGDAALLENYRRSHEQFRDAVQQLSKLPLDDVQVATLNAADASEAAIFRQIADASASPQNLKSLHVSFSPLLKSVQEFLSGRDAQSKREGDAMQAIADRASGITVWLLIAVVPFAILLAMGFSGLITRPIRQIDEAVRAIGGGELSRPISIDGPQDLRQLAERLNWMRLSLLEIEKQKTTFLQHVSHELKTPLTSIREGADLLAEGIAGQLTPKQNEIVQILYTNSVQLQKRIEDLLAFNALQTGKAVLVRQRVVLAELLDEVVGDHYLALRNKALAVELVCPDLQLDGDKQKLRIIVDNLLSNAIKYSSQGGQIKILAVPADGQVCLDVIDFGAGIDPEDREMIFDAFYQGRKAPQGRTRGTGLGLSIAREYAVAHGGSIRVAESAAGTCFRVMLPMAQAVAA